MFETETEISPVKKTDDQSHKTFVKNMASIPPLHQCVVGGAINGTKKVQSGRKHDWLLVNKLSFFSFFLPVPYIGVSMEQQRSPGLDNAVPAGIINKLSQHSKTASP